MTKDQAILVSTREGELMVAGSGPAGPVSPRGEAFGGEGQATKSARPRMVRRSLSLGSNMLWTLAGNTVYAGCQWLLLVIIAKLTDPEQVGEFALALALSAPVFMLTNLQLRAAQATDVKGQYVFSDYLGLRLVMTALAFCAVLSIALFSGYHGRTLAVIAILTIAKCAEAISDVYFGALQQQEWMGRIARSMVMKGVFSVMALGSTLLLTRHLLFAYSALAVSWIAVLVFYDVKSVEALLGAGENRPRFCFPVMRDITYLAAPLGFSMMLISLYLNVPRYYVERSLGTRELGLFAAMTYVVVAGSTVVNALGQAATPRLARLFAAGARREFNTMVARLCSTALVLGGAGVLLSALFGARILSLLYRPEYARRIDVFVTIMASAGISYCGNFLGYALTAARAFRQSVAVYLAITLVAAFSGLLIPRFGLLGAGWSMCLTGLCTCIAPFLVLRRLRTESV